MNLHRLLQQRAAEGKPLRVAVIGAGKFGSMFLSQARRTPGIHITAVVDLKVERARESLARVGWPAEEYAARSIQVAATTGATHLMDDSQAAIASNAVDIVVDATGNSAAGIRHALACCAEGKHIVMDLCSHNALRRQASCIPSRMATSPRSSAKWSIGRALPGSKW
jgi:predicted homoserine dehydrogenase-like protein